MVWSLKPWSLLVMRVKSFLLFHPILSHGFITRLDNMEKNSRIIYCNIMENPDTISFLGLHGCGNEALERFREMDINVAVSAALSTCSHSGLVERGMNLSV